LTIPRERISPILPAPKTAIGWGSMEVCEVFTGAKSKAQGRRSHNLG
jgi:hypothetical protein